MAEYPNYDPAGQPTDAEFDEVWAYVSMVSGGTCDGHWYDPHLDSWVLVRGYFYSRDPEHRPRLQSSICVQQRFFVSCREHRMTIAQGLERVQLADKIRETLPWPCYLILADVDRPVAVMHIKN